jgi:hypothetical protein
MNESLKEKFNSDLQRLVGKECWGIIEGIGSIIHFVFGEKIPLDTPVGNDYLSDELNNFEGEFTLFIQCVWRIDSPTNVIFGAWTEHKIVHQEINRIIGQTVKIIECSEPAFDLKITFSNDLSLSIFCDQTNEEDSNDNYDYFTPEIIYSVGHKSNLKTENYESK